MLINEAGSFLTINLQAIADNWRSLQTHLGTTECAAVLKADAYGLGAKKIAKKLYAEGCRTFFTAYAFEGAALRPVVGNSKIYLLHGAWEGCENLCFENDLIPVLGTLRQLEFFEQLAIQKGKKITVGLHIDTGMTRFGLNRKNVEDFCANPTQNLHFDLIVSHLACADVSDHCKNLQQLDFFKNRAAQIEKAIGYSVKKSLSASDGCCFQNKEFYQDIGRAGVILYDNAVKLESRILQIADADLGQTIGYGATYQVGENQRFATLGIGYADGFFRSLFNNASVMICGYKCPVVGKISMDLIVVDVSHIPYEILKDATTAEIFGDQINIKEFAKNAGTIDYEVLTNLGSRFYRIYK